MTGGDVMARPYGRTSASSASSGRDDVGADRLEHLRSDLGDAVVLTGVHGDQLEDAFATVLLEASRAARHRVAARQRVLHGFPTLSWCAPGPVGSGATAGSRGNR